MELIIGVDQGNRMYKTKSHSFLTGLNNHGKVEPPLSNQGVLLWDKTYYSLSSTRMYYKKDKTEDPVYFAMTLIAIAMEIRDRIKATDGVYKAKIVLALGVPPAHQQQLKDKYIEKFGNGGKSIRFTFEGEEYFVKISDVFVFPQGLSAVRGAGQNKVSKALTKTDQALIVDIGGYTTDVIPFVNGRADVTELVSLEMGIIKLYARIRKEIENQYDIRLTEGNIDAFLISGQKVLNKEQSTTVGRIVTEYAERLLQEINDLYDGFGTKNIVFVGGGATVMKSTLEKAKSQDNLFLADIKANAIGYEAAAKAKLAKAKENGGTENAK